MQFKSLVNLFLREVSEDAGVRGAAPGGPGVGEVENVPGSTRINRLRALRRILAQADQRRPGVGNWTMFQVRIHGRGGQGVVTAAEVLSHLGLPARAPPRSPARPTLAPSGRSAQA